MKTRDTTKLEDIHGLGRTRVDVFRKMEINTPADLARASPDAVVAGFEELNHSIKLDKACGLIARAGQLVTVDGGASEATDWRQRGEFTIFFEQASTEDGTEAWRTCVYDSEAESGEVVFEGRAVREWATWIESRLGLPVNELRRELAVRQLSCYEASARRLLAIEPSETLRNLLRAITG